MQSISDVAWWFGWTANDVDALGVEEFLDWQREAARQIKAGYSKGW